MLLSSDCPAWAAYCRKNEALAGQLSSTGTPLTLLARECRKQCQAEAAGKQVYVVSFTACTAEKQEVLRNTDGVDAALTVNELADFIKRGCVSRFTAIQTWRTAAEGSFDTLENMDPSTGVLDRLLELAPQTKVAEIRGHLPSQEELEAYKDCDLLHVMVCPGGCMNGGGQPRVHAKEFNTLDMLNLREGGDIQKISNEREGEICGATS